MSGGHAIAFKNLYASDTAHHTPLGKPLFEPGPTADEMKRVLSIMETCRDKLIAMPDMSIKDQSAKDDLKFIDDIWVYRYNECSLEEAGDSVGDMLYAARCYILCLMDANVRSMAELMDIKQLYTRLQLMACNHTRKQYDKPWSAMECEELDKRCACLVVYYLSDPMEDVMRQLGDLMPPIDPLLHSIMLPLRCVPDVNAAPKELTKEEIAQKKREQETELLNVEQGISSMKIGKNYDECDPNEGALWHTDKLSVVQGFVRMASRVLRNYWLERRVFEKFPIAPFGEIPTYSEYNHKCWTDWFKSRCNCDYSDSAISKFRDLAYEHMTPVGSRQETLRQMATKYDFMNPLNLLENQLGVDSDTALANIARTKPAVVSKDANHEVYEFLVLAQFAHAMQHELNTDFIADYYIMPGDLGQWHPRLSVNTSWNRPRRPILLRIMRALWIHHAGKWIPCKDMTDGLLKLMRLWATCFDCTLATGIPLKDFIISHTEAAEDDD